MNSITRNTEDGNQIMKFVMILFKEYHVGVHLKCSNIFKLKGFSVVAVFAYLIQAVFTNRSLYMSYLTGRNYLDFSKDTIYRFWNSTAANWLRFMSLLAASIVEKTFGNLTSYDRVDVLIVDDTLYNRNRSKKSELSSKVFDHVSHRYCYGYRLLTLG